MVGGGLEPVELHSISENAAEVNDDESNISTTDVDDDSDSDSDSDSDDGEPSSVEEPTLTTEPPASPRRKGDSSVFTKLTDTATYTGTHKQRFNSAGRGRGLPGRRDSQVQCWLELQPLVGTLKCCCVFVIAG